MILCVLLLWVLIQLAAPWWCYLLLGILAAVRMTSAVVKAAKKMHREREEHP